MLYLYNLIRAIRLCCSFSQQNVTEEFTSRYKICFSITTQHFWATIWSSHHWTTIQMFYR